MKNGSRVSVSVSSHILANNALRSHHVSAHGGVSTNGLSDICYILFEMIILSSLCIELLKVMFDGRTFQSLATHPRPS